MVKYNVIIVGAGPAGSYLAYKLKTKGINVLLLEKQKFPRYKACAGGLSKKAYDILYSDNINVTKIVEKSVSKGLYVRDNKFTVTEPKKELIYMTYRSKLDNLLVEIAVDDKTVFFKDKVSIKKIDRKDNTIAYIEKRKSHEVKYDVLVGAWGTNIKFNKLIDLNPIWRYSVSSSWEGPPGPRYKKYFEDHVLSQIMKKYPAHVGYIFPKSELITAGLFTSKNPDPKILKDMWKDFVKFWKLDNKIKPKYAWIPIRDFKKPIANNNMLLVGDAAGLTDPFVGEGIYYAFINGMIASKHIQNYFKIKDYNLAEEYNRDVDSKLFDVIKWAKVYESMFHYMPNFSFWLGSETSFGNKIVTSLITGEIKYNEIKKVIKLANNRIF